MSDLIKDCVFIVGSSAVFIHMHQQLKATNQWEQIEAALFVMQVRMTFLAWLRNRLLSVGLVPVLSQTEKSCIASDYRNFLRILKIEIIKLIPV